MHRILLTITQCGKIWALRPKFPLLLAAPTLDSPLTHGARTVPHQGALKILCFSKSEEKTQCFTSNSLLGARAPKASPGTLCPMYFGFLLHWCSMLGFRDADLQVSFTRRQALSVLFCLDLGCGLGSWRCWGASPGSPLPALRR